MNKNPKNELIVVDSSQMEVTVSEDTGLDQEVEEDFRLARENLRELIHDGKNSIPGLMDVADQSQHPRSYEVLGNYLKLQAEMNKDLVEMAETKLRVRDSQRKSRNQGPSTVNQNLFITTADLQKMLKGSDES
jgi:ribosomal protein S14